MWNSRHTTFKPRKRMHLRVDPDMALSRLDVYITAAHCIIRPILLFRKWEEVSRAIIGVNMWWECVECYPHHFRAAQAHALARDPDMALSRRWRRCRGPRRWRAGRWSVRSCACETEKRASPCATSGAVAGCGAMQKIRLRVCKGASEGVRG